MTEYPKLADGSPDFVALRKTRDETAKIELKEWLEDIAKRRGCDPSELHVHVSMGNHQASCYCNCGEFYNLKNDTNVKLCEHDFCIRHTEETAGGAIASGAVCERCGLANWDHDMWLF